MDILVTGASGFVGSHLLTDLIHGHRLYALTRQKPPSQQDGVTWLSGDLSRNDFVLSLPDRMDAVICLAQSKAYRQFPEQARDIFEVNVNSTLSLLEYARRAGVQTFIFASTANVYRQSHGRIAEDFDLAPLSFYARSKRMAEMLVESYAEFFHCVVLRLFTVYGPGQKEMLIPNLIERVRNNIPLQVQGEHGFVTSPIYVSDVTKIIQIILERDHVVSGFDLLNVGGDEALGILELGHIIGNALNRAPQFDRIPGDQPEGWVADNSRLKNAMGLKSFISITDGIRKTVA